MTVALTLQDETGSPAAPGAARFEAWVDAVAEARPIGGPLTIRLVDEAEGRALNHRFRGRDSATNVLSFPFEPMPGLPADQAVLGDLVICTRVVESEAAEQGKNLEAHYAHMVVHGVLHLLGFDHQTEAEARRMERLERNILQGLGYADPYEPDTEQNGRATG